MNFNTDGLLSGHIGQLATEIAGEIDITNLENSNPSEMIQNLLSGNMNKDSPVLKLVHQISDKIQNKLTSGEVNEMDLFSEAQGAMKMMGGSNKNSPFNMLHKMTEKMHKNNHQNENEVADDISKQMEDMLKSSGLDPTAMEQVENAINIHKPSENNNDKRRFLKEKLKKKKQLIQTKKQLEKLRN